MIRNFHRRLGHVRRPAVAGRGSATLAAVGQQMLAPRAQAEPDDIFSTVQNTIKEASPATRHPIQKPCASSRPSPSSSSDARTIPAGLWSRSPETQSSPTRHSSSTAMPHAGRSIDHQSTKRGESCGPSGRLTRR